MNPHTLPHRDMVRIVKLLQQELQKQLSASPQHHDLATQDLAFSVGQMFANLIALHTEHAGEEVQAVREMVSGFLKGADSATRYVELEQGDTVAVEWEGAVTIH
ncbi:hypothetical protein FV139_00590 [Parahaliea maris]|uniref:Uncharacterized protein n=1 Tax=Parahaliea maris TaxID=2716870 RepID=A0A5C9A7F6_9GAMM|nr:hypothetical protein [Parahaliea maris]TXS96039.1 hypothetical protein FV139_00590 [Parahaliea maris]